MALNRSNSFDHVNTTDEELSFWIDGTVLFGSDDEDNCIEEEMDNIEEMDDFHYLSSETCHGESLKRSEEERGVVYLKKIRGGEKIINEGQH